MKKTNNLFLVKMKQQDSAKAIRECQCDACASNKNQTVKVTKQS